MKTQKLIAAVLLMAACLCFAGCGDESSSSNILEIMFPQGSGEPVSSLTDAEKEDSQVMLMFKVEPNAAKGNGQAATEYKVYYSGRVTDEKSGKEKNISDGEFEKLKKYADDIINGKVETKYDGGDESTNTTVAAYTMTGTPYQYSAMGDCKTDGFDEMYKIVTDIFKG